MKKYLIIFLITITPKIYGGSYNSTQVEYRADSWSYLEILEGMASYCSFNVNFLKVNLGIGGKEKYNPGIGIGCTLIDMTGFWDDNFYKVVVDSTQFYEGGPYLTQTDTINVLKNFFVPSLKLMIPLADIQKRKSGGYYYPSVLHFSIQGASWKNKHISIGAGIDYSPNTPVIPVTVGIEGGFLQRWLDDEIKNSFYVGARLSLGGWTAKGAKETKTRKTIALDTDELYFNIKSKYKEYKPGENVEFIFRVTNYSDKSIDGVCFDLGGSLTKYLLSDYFYTPKINSGGTKTFSIPFSLADYFPTGEYEIYVKDVYHTNIERVKITYRKTIREQSGKYSKQITLQWPTGSHQISSDYGWRNIWLRRQFHKGIDIPVPVGTPIMAAADGKVTFSGWRGGGYGYGIWVKHNKSFKTFYGHLSRCSVSKGAWVRAGERIGYSGETGKTTGPHLHFGVMKNGKFVDPELYLP